MYTITIKRGREDILRKHNSKVYSGAIAALEPVYSGPSLARVLDADGRFIAWGSYDEESHTVLTLLSWREEVVPDDGWLEAMVANAVDNRKHLIDERTNAVRLIHGDADFIPGLAADLYGDEIRILISSRFAHRHLETVVKALFNCTKAQWISSKVDALYAPSEHLKKEERNFSRGGEEKGRREGDTAFLEDGILYEITSGISQKSGFYLDQRNNRHIVEGYATGRRCLDACSFTGAFTLHLLRGGAESVLACDASESVLRHLLYQVNINEDRGLIPAGSRSRVAIRKADVFSLVRQIEEDEFDLIVLDPPKLAKKRDERDGAMRGYKDLNLWAMRKIRDGGIVAAFSCSGAISRQDFNTAVSYAAADAHVDLQILEELSAGPDHPVRASMSETAYLKGLVYRVVK